MKKVAMFISFQDFRDEEYIEPKKILQAEGIKVDTVSSAKGKARGKFGAIADVDKVISDINALDYDALCLVGGAGCLQYLDNAAVYNVFKQAFNENKLIGSICISPVILAHAGLLKDKKATVWQDGADELKLAGAIYTGADVEMDGKIITANGPEAAQEYAKRLVEELK
ncbi:MAG: DJ-1/PfpI family protein [Elusimicrobiota bacterium]|nr:DJ-1/PfpI family protein [Elusimicrobiota bacterium]